MGGDQRNPINKTMARSDLDSPRAARVVTELDDLVRGLAGLRLRPSSWYGTLDFAEDPMSWERVNRGYHYEPLPGAANDRLYPWFLYWEIAWLVINNDFRPGQTVLDLGGSSSLFSCYLAAAGLEVTAIDLNDELIANGEKIAARTGWKLHNVKMDMTELNLAETFDHVTSVCVYEHLPVTARVTVSQGLRDLLRPGGTFSVTFDYLNPTPKARLSSSEAVDEQIIQPSGLIPRGNRRFCDAGERQLLHPTHHPLADRRGWTADAIEREGFEPEEASRTLTANEYTFGAFFLEKAAPR